jgi:phage tail-like protein
MGPLAEFNFRVLFSAPAAENRVFETAGNALAAVGAAAGAVLGGAENGTIRAGFAEVSGLNSELEVEEYREGGRNIGPRRFPRWGRFSTLVLRRGITADSALWDWWGDVISRSYTLPSRGLPSPRRSGVILLDGPDHKAGAAWFFANALPERLAGPGLNARGNGIAIETLELSHEGLIRLRTVPPGV